jgi:hypothetical protein
MLLLFFLLLLRIVTMRTKGVPVKGYNNRGTTKRQKNPPAFLWFLALKRWSAIWSKGERATGNHTGTNLTMPTFTGKVCEIA